MDHYEELGLCRTASSEEIHGAYRALARLLHPDSQQNEQARVLAECQMRRLNGVMETLSSAERRAAYDRHLASGAGRLRFSRRVRRARRPGTAATVWISTTVVALLGLFLFFREDLGRLPSFTPPSAKVQALERENERLRRELEQVRRSSSPEPHSEAPY